MKQWQLANHFLARLNDIAVSCSCDWQLPTKATATKHDCAIVVVPVVPFDRVT